MKQKDLDRSLVATLDAIYQDDQMARHQIDSVEQKYGRDSKKYRILERNRFQRFH